MRKPFALIFVGILVGCLAASVVARVETYPLTIFGRRLSPSWIRLDGEAVGAADLRALYERVDDKEEFHAMILLNEIHGHIDPWSMIGCKMAMRAMDLLRADYISMTAYSEAGDVLPEGAVTDGIAIGSGAMIGLGKLKLTGGAPRVAATFLFEELALRLEADADVVAVIRDSSAAIETETGGAEYVQYWQRLRDYGIRVWEELDRDEIFIETWVDPASVTAVAGGAAPRPTAYALSQNHPNPFNAATVITFETPQETELSLLVYDAAGRKVRTLLSGRTPSGQTRLTWDGRDDGGRAVAGGVYFYQLEGQAGPIGAKKMCLVR